MSTLKSDILVSQVMISMNRIPLVEKNAIMKEAIEEMGRKRLGIACIVNAEKDLLGILTDGDIRRKLMRVQKPFSAILVDDALDYSIRAPSTIQPDEKLIRAVEMMEEKQIWDLPVVSNEGKLVGLLHLHPAVQALLGMQK
jgi:arabinose-5-phosphate isomerase